MTNVLAIAAGGSNCLVRLSDGRVITWAQKWLMDKPTFRPA